VRVFCFGKLIDMGINKEYWLKRKLDGSGWVPTWQGWSLVIAFILLAIVGAWVLKDTPRNTFSIELLLYIVYVVSLIVAIVWLSLKKGPAPKRRWNKHKDDDQSEDY
jgi:hypothetical protein